MNGVFWLFAWKCFTLIGSCVIVIVNNIRANQIKVNEWRPLIGNLIENGASDLYTKGGLKHLAHQYAY